MAIYFFPLSLLNDVIQSDNLSQWGLPASGEFSRHWELLPLSGHSTVRKQLVCLWKLMNIQPPPQRNITPQFLFCCLVVCFLFQYQVASWNSTKEIQKNFYTWMSPVKYRFYKWRECLLAFMNALSSFLTLQCKSDNR